MIKKVTKPKRKYDFPLIKQDFFTSEHNDVKGYFELKYGVYNNHIQRSTGGWSKEKLEWREGMVQKALDHIQDSEARENYKALLVILGAMRYKLSRQERVQSMTWGELEKAWEIFMTMNGKPTKITHATYQPEEKPFNYTEDAKQKLDECIGGAS